MANKSLSLDDGLYRYLQNLGVREPDVLVRLREATALEEGAEMRSAPEQGQFMAWMLKLMNARRVIEIGTYTGYASLWMAMALPDDGWLITCEVEQRWAFMARRFWEQAGVAGRIELHLRPAMETLEMLLSSGEKESYDFVFIDADKERYTDYYEASLLLLRKGGVIAVDNTLWGGAVADAERHDVATEAIRSFNRFVHDDERVDLAMLPVADGLTLLMKR
ncbi:MAG: methyltransferase [Zetaproteobacteria bacterium]|nr:MAG: methyltransferase [Zetaproteobacteria bacterium]